MTTTPTRTPDLEPGIQTFIGADVSVPVEYLLLVNTEEQPATRTLYWRFAGPDADTWQRLATLAVADWPGRLGITRHADVVPGDDYDPRVGEVPC